MKRTLIALALTGLTLGANVAVADTTSAAEEFLQREGTSVVAAEVATQDTVQRNYEQVDGYNN